jgi:hypothetical protein
MLVRFYNIVWDTEEDSEELKDVKPADLPTEIPLEVEEDADVDLEGADVLSDQFGYSVRNFDWEKACTSS